MPVPEHRSACQLGTNPRLVPTEPNRRGSIAAPLPTGQMFCSTGHVSRLSSSCRTPGSDARDVAAPFVPMRGLEEVTAAPGARSNRTALANNSNARILDGAFRKLRVLQ